MNTDIFKKLIKSNTDSLNNLINTAAEDYLFKHKNLNHLTEDEAREIALKVFLKVIHDRANEIIKSKLNP